MRRLTLLVFFGLTLVNVSLSLTHAHLTGAELLINFWPLYLTEVITVIGLLAALRKPQ